MADAGAPGAIVVFCKTCGKKLRAPASAAGQRGKCGGCGSVFRIPAASETRPPLVTRQPSPHPARAPATVPQGDFDHTTTLERLGRRNGLILGGVVVAVALLAVILAAGHVLLSAPPAAGDAPPPAAGAPPVAQAPGAR